MKFFSQKLIFELIFTYSCNHVRRVPWSAQRRCFAWPQERVSSSPCHSTPSFKLLTEKTRPNPDHADLLRPSACTCPADFAMFVKHHECYWVQCGALSCEDLSQWVAESYPDLLDWPGGSEHQWNRPLNKFQTVCKGITAFSQQCRAEFGCLQNVRITGARFHDGEVCRSTPQWWILEMTGTTTCSESLSQPPNEKVLEAETRALTRTMERDRRENTVHRETHRA